MSSIKELVEEAKAAFNGDDPVRMRLSLRHLSAALQAAQRKVDIAVGAIRNIAANGQAVGKLGAVAIARTALAQIAAMENTNDLG
jgi:hypothetical protein